MSDSTPTAGLPLETRDAPVSTDADRPTTELPGGKTGSLGRFCAGCGARMSNCGVARMRNGALTCATCDPSGSDRHRSRPPRTAPRARTLSRGQLRVLGPATPPDYDSERPRTWGECRDKTGPCGFVSCPSHLFLDVSPITGSIKLNFPHLEPDELLDPCVLRIAERGPITLSEAGTHMNLTRERTRQIEISGIAKLRGKRSLR